MSYPKPIPVDLMRSPMQEYPPALPALQSVGNPALTVSSIVTFDSNATNVEISVTNGVFAAPGVAMKWITETDTTASVVAIGTSANFDHVIPTGNARKFVIPKEKAASNQNVGANIKNGLYQRMALITLGTIPSSVFTTTY